MKPLPRWLPWIAVAALLAVLLCHHWYGGDIWYHLYLGGRIIPQLTPQPSDNLILHQRGYVNIYWLFQLVVRAAYGVGGIAAVTLLFAAFWVAAFGAWLKTTQLRRAGAWGAAAALVAVVVCQTRYEERPEILSYVFLALQIHWLANWDLSRPPGKWAYGRFALVEALWANVHGYFAFGPLLVALRIASEMALQFDPSRSSRPSGEKSLQILLAFTILASLASPFGLHGWIEVFAFGRVLHQLRFAIQELLPTWAVPARVWTVAVFWGAWLAALAAAGWLAATAWRRELFALFLAALGLYLGATAYRNIPLFIFLCAPLIAALRARLVPGGDGPGRAAIGVTLAAGALAVWAVAGGYYRSLGLPTAFGIGESATTYPCAFAAYFRTREFSGSVFNSMADGGYLEFHFPRLRLYSDPRITDPAAEAKYFAALRRPLAFYGLQSECGFDAALLSVTESPQVIASLLRERSWILAHADLHRAFFVSRLSSSGVPDAARELDLYRGEDLTLPQNEFPAILWVAAFASAGDRGGLLAALRAFSAAPQVPSSLIQIARRFGVRRGDPAVTEACRLLEARSFHATPIRPAVLDQLIPLGGSPHSQSD